MHPYVAALLGGILIGLAATLLMRAHGRIMGISGMVGGLLPPARQSPAAWRWYFLAGMLLALLLTLLFGHSAAAQPYASGLAMALAGLLVGIGTTLGSGCTSGHGVCGLARLSTRSLVATLTFIASAMLTVWVGNLL